MPAPALTDELREVETQVARDEGPWKLPMPFVHCAALGSKYLAVGRPESVAIIGLADELGTLAELHRYLFPDINVLSTLKHPLCQLVDLEDACASEIVCTSWDEDIDSAFLPEGTHLNLLARSELSPRLCRALRSTRLCSLGPTMTQRIEAERLCHGTPNTLHQVLCGQVSGRVDIEITALICPPDKIPTLS